MNFPKILNLKDKLSNRKKGAKHEKRGDVSHIPSQWTHFCLWNQNKIKKQKPNDEHANIEEVNQKRASERAWKIGTKIDLKVQAMSDDDFRKQ